LFGGRRDFPDAGATVRPRRAVRVPEWDTVAVLRAFLIRHQPPTGNRRAALAGLGAGIALLVIGSLGAITGQPLVMAPFGASAVLLFAVPGSPLSQPANVVGGHVVATAIALLFRFVLPGEWWVAAIAVGTVVGVLAALRLTHPPAGADPLVVFASDPGLSFLALPVLVGAALLVLIATAFHRFSGSTYPLAPPIHPLPQPHHAPPPNEPKDPPPPRG
jgi:CBS-domain-containing membrane protein